MSSAQKKSNSAIQTKALPIGGRMLALEPRYVFDAAIATELHDLTMSGPISHDVDAGHADVGASVIAASRELTAFETRDGSVAVQRDTTVERSIEMLVNAHNLAPSNHEIAFIDSRLADLGTLVNSIPDGTRIVLIDTSRDGVAQMVDALKGEQGVTGIHILSHGNDGEIQVGTSSLDEASMSTVYRSALSSIRGNLSADADILVYGCDFGAGAVGARAASLLADLTGADVAASTNLTGGVQGADWVLESTTGTVDSRTIVAADWQHELLDINANDGSTTTVRSTAVSGNLMAQVTAANPSAPVVFTAETKATAHGSVTIRANGTYTYTPATGFLGTDSFVFEGAATDPTDGVTQYATAIETITINPDPGYVITANSETNTVGYERSFSGTVADNVTASVRGGPITTYTRTSGPSNGTVAFDTTTGAYTYTPNAGFYGQDSFTFSGDDASPDSDPASATVTLNVSPPPLIAYSYDSFGVNNNAVTVRPYVSEADSAATLSYSYGTSANGTLTGDGSGNFTLTPNTGFTGDTSVTYTVTDSNGYVSSNTLVFHYSVTGVAPLAAYPDTYTLRQGDTAYQGVSYFETNTNGVAPIYSFTQDTAPAHGTISFNTATGNYQYIATPGYLGPDSFAFTVRDQYNQLASSTESINVVPPDMSVIASVRFAPIGAAVAGNLSAETSESAGNTNEVYSINGTVLTNGAMINTAHGVATITNAATGAYSWQPNAGFSGVEVINWSVKNVWGPNPTDFYEVERSTDTIVSPNKIFAGHRGYVIPENTTRTGTVTEFSGSPNGTPAYTPTFAAAHGSATVNADGSYSYTPNTGYHGFDKFGYKLANGLGNTATGYVTIYTAGPLVPGNGAPTVVAIPDRANLDNSAPSVSVASYFTDPNSDRLTFFADGLPPGLSMDTDGNINGTVDRSASQGADFQDGRYTVTVFADDNRGGVVQQTFEWRITNPAPVANPVTVYTPFNTARIVDLIGVPGNTGADLDPDGDAISVVANSVSVSAAQGTVAFNGTNWVFTPATGFTGNAQISYTITDADGATASSTHNVIVGPSAVNDAYTTQLDTTLTTGNAARGDIYLPGSSFAVATPALHGTVTMASDGRYNYVPAAGYTGADSFTYTITDPNGQTATATDTIFINTRPALVDPDISTGPFINPGDSSNLIVPAVDNIPVSLPLASYFSDINGDPVTITPNMTGVPTWLTYDSGTRSLVGTPPADNAGDVVVSVTVTDNRGGTYIATVTIQPVNPPLIANPETVLTPFNTARNVDLLGNDSNPDRDTLTVTSANVSAAQGTVAFNGTNWVFTPATGFTGNAQITYSIRDIDGATATSTHNVIVGPSAINDVYTTQLNTPVDGNAALADTYVANSTFVVVTGPTHGSVVMVADGSYRYTPTTGYFGTDTFTYTVTDPSGQVATATDTITINIAPTLVDPSPVVGAPYINPIDPTNLIVPAVDNVPVSLPLGPYFTDGNGDPMTITPTGLPTWLSYDPMLRTLTGTPPADNVGPVTIPVTVTDGNGGTFTGSITIQPVNPGPDAVTDSVGTPLNTPVDVNLLRNDTDPDGDRLTVTAATVDPAQGTVAFNGTAWVFTPVTGFTGTATISYTITDIDGATDQSTHLVYVGVAAVDDAYTTQVNTSVSGNMARGDTFSPLSTFSIVTGPTHGTLNALSDGTYTYTPNAGYTGTDTFVYRVTDTNGMMATATDTITINAAPALTDPSQAAGTPFIDPADGANLIVPTVDTIVVNLPIAPYYVDPNGDPMTLAPNLTGLPAWLSYNPATQTFTGTPPRDNTGVDIVVPVTVTDNNGGTFASTVTFRIVNPGPTANTDSITTTINTAVGVNLLANDTDPDGDALSVLGTPTVNNPAEGSVALVNGTWVFTPATGFTGVATINYTIQDADGATSSSTHDVTVLPLAAVDDSYTTAYTTPVNGNAATGDTFPVGSTFSTSTLPGRGIVAMNSDGTYTYTPAAGFAGTDTFRYLVTAPGGGTVMATETIIVTPPSLSAVNDTYTTPFRTAVQGNAATGDVFAVGSSFVATSQPASGILVMGTNGTYTYTPAANFTGTVTFNYSVTDPVGQTRTAVETIIVSPPQLIAVSDAYTTGYNQTLNGTAATGDTFTSGSRFTVATAPGRGTVTMNTDGTFRYIPRRGFTGTDTFTYTITDPTGRTVTATETITIAPRVAVQRCLTTFGRITGFTPRRR